MSDIVHRIISKHTTDRGETASRPVVQDITDLFATKTRIKTTGRGTALIMFPGPVPELFQRVMRDKTAELLADTTGRNTISMEVDAKFIGMTQLHGPPPDVKHMAEYVPMSCSGLNASRRRRLILRIQHRRHPWSQRPSIRELAQQVGQPANVAEGFLARGRAELPNFYLRLRVQHFQRANAPPV